MFGSGNFPPPSGKNCCLNCTQDDLSVVLLYTHRIRTSTVLVVMLMICKRFKNSSNKGQTPTGIILTGWDSSHPSSIENVHGQCCWWTEHTLVWCYKLLNNTLRMVINLHTIWQLVWIYCTYSTCKYVYHVSHVCMYTLSMWQII